MLFLLAVLFITCPDFATCSLILHNHRQRCNQVVENLREPRAKHLSVYAFLRRAERSLFIHGQLKMISFFHCPWHLSAVHLIKSKFLGNYWSEWSKFCLTTTTGWRPVIFQILTLRKFFGDLLAEKRSFRTFFRAKAIFFSPVVRVGMGILLFFALFDGTPNQRCVVIIFAELFLSASFRRKNGNFSNVTEQFCHSPLLTTFRLCDVYCLQTHLQKPFAYWIASLAR